MAHDLVNVTSWGSSSLFSLPGRSFSSDNAGGSGESLERELALLVCGNEHWLSLQIESF